MKKIGIDVSTHNGRVDWNNIKCDFAIIRTGFGSGDIDTCFEHNVENCIVPYGVYHFSYAYSVERAEREADFVISILKKYDAKPTLPVFFDWEYDSDRYAKQNGVIVDRKLFSQMAVAFMEKIRQAGYKVGIYYNYDYLKRYCDNEVLNKEKYCQWFAYYGDSINVDCDIWQNSENGIIEGFKGDTNILYNEALLTPVIKPIKKSNEEIAQEVWDGKWGDGLDRKNRLIEAGYDYNEIQKIVTATQPIEEHVFAKGDIVKIKKGAKSYDNKTLARFVYDEIYRIDELSGNRAVLDKNGICTPININDLILA